VEVILHLDTFFKDCQMPQQLHLHPLVLLSVSSTLLCLMDILLQTVVDLFSSFSSKAGSLTFVVKGAVSTATIVEACT
jgi:hypothetical protein